MFIAQNILYFKKNNAALLFSCCIFFFLLLSCNGNSQKTGRDAFNEPVVLRVNDITILEEEYMMFLEEEKAMTYNYFFQKYGVEKSNTFWQSSYHSESPMDYIKEKTRQRLVKEKVIQSYASKIGVIKPFNFEVFKNDWKAENENRRLKHKAGDIVYGPVETSMKEYYSYLQTNLEIRLKDKLATTIFKPSENKLRAYYEDIKDLHFTYIDSVNVEYLSFPYNSSTQREQSLEAAKEAYEEALKINKALKSLTSKYSNAIYQQKEFFDDVKLYGEENPDKEVKNYASGLKFGEIKLIDTKAKMNSSIYIMRLFKPVKQHIRSFEKVRKEALYYYNEIRYKQLIDSLNNNARWE